MPSPERREQPDASERPPIPYFRASRFANDRLSAAAYEQIRDALFRQRRLDLSVYRVLLDAAAHLIILGATPPNHWQRRLDRLLAAGEPVDLPPDVLELLWQR